ncbi:DUF664 domain-containing protein [Nocardioides coralli]|uniref:mycothiol transferase n=1 Tax=Nocardioides coralli TaxID=2872154 RepID=UPI001CA45E1E|nr:DUF664 domain-containing protein [Nocardioides coralli]QZY29785.1 DinB family protein [Nocardioides coralli]
MTEPGREDGAGPARWADYLDWVRGELVAGVLGLPPEQQRTTRVPSGWTPIELLSHVLHMEQRWFVWGFLGEPVAEPWGDWNVEEPWADDDSGTVRDRARWVVADEVTADHLAAQVEAVGRRTREVVLGHALDDTAARGGRFADDPPTLEWICFHVLAEYARHAGHLDIVVELAHADGD